MAEALKPRRKIFDKLILVAIAVAIVAPFAVLYAFDRELPLVSQSADDLRQLDKDEGLIVTRGLDDEGASALDHFIAPQELELHYSLITDAGMKHVGEIRCLKRLVLGAPEVTDKGVQELATLAELKNLALLDCIKVTPDGLMFLDKLGVLETLVLHRLNSVDDRLGPIVAGCKALTRLELQSLRGVTDAVVADIAKLTGLRVLYIELCPKVTHGVLPLIAQLAGLEELSLIGMDTMTDDSVQELAKLTKLRKLNLPERGELTPAGLEKLKAALPQCEFNQ